MRMNLLRVVFAVAVAFGLTACTTTGDVMQRAPAAQFASTRTVAQVSGCIAPRVFKEWAQSKVTPSGDGSMIVVSGSAWGNPMAIINVQPVASGSQIAIQRGGIVSDRVFEGIVHNAKACR